MVLYDASSMNIFLSTDNALFIFYLFWRVLLHATSEILLVLKRHLGGSLGVEQSYDGGRLGLSHFNNLTIDSVGDFLVRMVTEPRDSNGLLEAIAADILLIAHLTASRSYWHGAILQDNYRDFRLHTTSLV